MNKIVSYLLICFLPFSGVAQSYDFNKTPYIDVTGSAEIEIDPDEIHLTICIGERIYKDEDQDEKLPDPVTLAEAEKNLSDVISKAGVSKDKVILDDVYSRYRWYASESHYTKLEKRYRIIFDNFDRFDKFLEILAESDKGVSQVYISGLKNKNMAEYRKQVKTAAIKAAKEKAEYLTAAIGCVVVSPIEIIENKYDDNYFYGTRASNISMSNVWMNNTDPDDKSSDFKKIKIRHEIRARFEIK